MAPANVSSVGDLVEYHIADASPVATPAPTGYVERYIHSEIYKKYPRVNSVIHSHSDAVIPYCNSSKKKYSNDPRPYFSLIVKVDAILRSCIHMAGFLGEC